MQTNDWMLLEEQLGNDALALHIAIDRPRLKPWATLMAIADSIDGGGRRGWYRLTYNGHYSDIELVLTLSGAKSLHAAAQHPAAAKQMSSTARGRLLTTLNRLRTHGHVRAVRGKTEK